MYILIYIVGNLYLKGEGVIRNDTAAVEWYKKALYNDDKQTRALNGLGFAYFHGRGVAQNYTAALEYFVAAASFQADGDSLFNAGHMYYNGTEYYLYLYTWREISINYVISILTKEVLLLTGYGTEVDLTVAHEYFKIAASKFGHFESIYHLGNMYSLGQGVTRSCGTATQYYGHAIRAGGRWG